MLNDFQQCRLSEIIRGTAHLLLGIQLPDQIARGSNLLWGERPSMVTAPSRSNWQIRASVIMTEL
jgi:hypothetical protein